MIARPARWPAPVVRSKIIGEPSTGTFSATSERRGGRRRRCRKVRAERAVLEQQPRTRWRPRPPRGTGHLEGRCTGSRASTSPVSRLAAGRSARRAAVTASVDPIAQIATTRVPSASMAAVAYAAAAACGSDRKMFSDDHGVHGRCVCGDPLERRDRLRDARHRDQVHIGRQIAREQSWNGIRHGVSGNRQTSRRRGDAKVCRRGADRIGDGVTRLRGQPQLENREALLVRRHPASQGGAPGLRVLGGRRHGGREPQFQVTRLVVREAASASRTATASATSRDTRTATGNTGVAPMRVGDGGWQTAIRRRLQRDVRNGRLSGGATARDEKTAHQDQRAGAEGQRDSMCATASPSGPNEAPSRIDRSRSANPASRK